MEQLQILDYVTILLIILCLLLFAIWFLENKKRRNLTLKLHQLSMSLKATKCELDELKVHQKQDQIFQNSLEAAELTTKLQKPRLDVLINSKEQASSGKYSDIKALAAQGHTISEIATTLGISTHEAEQLVNLSKLTQPN